jgi:EmrB/QacA subfamily drug resistance transporter
MGTAEVASEYATTATASTSPATAPLLTRPGIALWVVTAVACLAQFMVVLDTAIVNVALPSMKRDLGLSVNSQQWVVDAYLLTFGGLLLVAARAGDLFGRRRVLLLGLGLFTLGSLGAGLANDGTLLLIARALQGVGAAALAPASLSLITASHDDPTQRARAIGVWGASAASAAAIGVVLGGVLTEALNWRWVFFINVPIGVVLAVAAVLSLLPSTKLSKRRVPLDLPGAATITGGLASLIFGISRTAAAGWGSAEVTFSLVVAVGLLVGFVFIESRSAAPLVRLGIFRLSNLRNADISMLGLGMALTASLFFLSLYLQQVLGYSPLRTGLALLPMAAVLGAGSLASCSLVTRGVRHLPVYGGLAAAGGLSWLTQLPAHSAYLTAVLGPSVITGVGFSVMMLPLTAAATAGIPHHEAGMSSGLLNVSRQIGGAIGLAILVTLASSLTHNERDTTATLATLSGFRAAFLGTAIACVLTAVAASRVRSVPQRPATKI